MDKEEVLVSHVVDSVAVVVAVVDSVAVATVRPN